MTNAEKFEEVFGFPPHSNARCIAPKEICDEEEGCKTCPFRNWWNKEYKPCFVWNKSRIFTVKENEYESDKKN